ncbi:ATP-binding protein [Candidatus Halobeggiatoa sp. HSG11]|nr:ATP-binding protein [Candidatus Halobeggiatoa sp. HSG11]
METQIFGHFVEDSSGSMEYLKIGLLPSCLSIKESWQTNGLSADFIANYVQTFFIGQPQNTDAPIPIQSKHAVKYIANELLENAMKFNDNKSQHFIEISFKLYNDKLIFHVTHDVNSKNVVKLKEFLKEIINGDPQDLYFNRMEANAINDDKGSGLGLLSMMCDYSAKLGWKFEISKYNAPITLTTMVCLNI